MKTAKDLIIPFSWQERHPVLLDRFFYMPAKYEHTPKSYSFFEKEQPIVIEYCSGNGQWIAEKAKDFPHLNWLAVEKRFDRARKVWLKSFNENLPNLSVVCGEGFIFTKCYAPTTHEIFINFPDPWPKRRHAPYRLVRHEFLKAISNIAISQGKATCVTDDATYARQMVEEFSKCPEWKLLFNGNDWPEYGRSFFKDLWSEAGREIHYLIFERI